jgi:hypothetical protein
MVDSRQLSTARIPPLLFAILLCPLQNEGANVAGLMRWFLPVLSCLKAVVVFGVGCVFFLFE